MGFGKFHLIPWDLVDYILKMTEKSPLGANSQFDFFPEVHRVGCRCPVNHLGSPCGTFLYLDHVAAVAKTIETVSEAAAVAAVPGVSKAVAPFAIPGVSKAVAPSAIPGVSKAVASAAMTAMTCTSCNC